MPKQVEEGEPCEQCGHAFDCHALIAMTGKPRDGGIILCPVQGCECYATWGVSTDGTGTSPRPENVPDRFQVARLREALQATHADETLPPEKWTGLSID